MFFGKTKLRAQIFTDTLYAMRDYTSVDLDKLTIREQGELMDSVEKYHFSRRKYLSRNDFIALCWSSLLSQRGFGQSSFNESHTLYGKEDELLRGLADFVLPIWDDLAPYVHGNLSRRMEEIPDRKSRTGKDISRLLEV